MQIEIDRHEETLLIFSIHALIRENQKTIGYWLERAMAAGPIQDKDYKNKAARYQQENMELQVLLAKVDSLTKV